MWFGFSEILYQFGFGKGYMVVTRPIILYSIGLMLSGLIIAMVGIICDFILHHDAARKVENIINAYKHD
jgi:hypothetical protein